MQKKICADRISKQDTAGTGMESKKKNKKNKITIVVAIASIVIVVAAVNLVSGRLEKREDDLAEVLSESISSVSEPDEEEQEGVLTYQGEQYQENDHLSTYLFMGVDSEETIETAVGSSEAGLADAEFLLVWNRQTGDVTIISIPRDSMTAVDVYGPGGSYLGESTTHICLAFSYGDGGSESCKLQMKAVSNLLYGIEIDGYCAVSLDVLSMLSDAVGGVTVTVPDDSLESAYPDWTEGTEITLTGENTEAFVRYRNIEVSQSALTRLNRQKVYLDAFSEKAKSCFAEDAGFISDLYMELEPYMTTNITNDVYVHIMQGLATGGEQSGWTVPGEGVSGELYDEYYVDDDSLYDLIIETFYEKV